MFRDKKKYKEQFWQSKRRILNKDESEIGARGKKEARGPNRLGWIKIMEISLRFQQINEFSQAYFTSTPTPALAPARLYFSRTHLLTLSYCHITELK